MRSIINPRARAALHHRQPIDEDKPRRMRRKRAHREAKAHARLVKSAEPDIRRAQIALLAALSAYVVLAAVIAFVIS